MYLIKICIIIKNKTEKTETQKCFTLSSVAYFTVTK